MSLPDKHRTARFESLPQRLKAKAEAIINKKFGLSSDQVILNKLVDHYVDTQKAQLGGAVFIANGIDPVEIDVDHTDFLRKCIVLKDTNYWIEYSPTRLQYIVETECPDCYEMHSEYINTSDADNFNLIGRTWICEDCKAQLNLSVRPDTFPKRPEAKIRGEFKVGDICTIVDSQSPTWTGYRDGDTVTVISESNFGSYEVRRADNRYTQTLHGEQLTLKSPW